MTRRNSNPMTEEQLQAEWDAENARRIAKGADPLDPATRPGAEPIDDDEDE